MCLQSMVFYAMPAYGERTTVNSYQVYEQAIKSLSAEEKRTIARLIMDEVVPNAAPYSCVSLTEQDLTAVCPPRQFGAGRHLLSGAGIDVDELMATPIDDVFSEYVPEEPDAAHH